MDNIKYENFKNICRMCMLDCCINFTKDAVISDIYHKLTNIHFVTNDEIPQQICLKCFEFINEIHRFSMTCKHTHSVLMKCLNNYKNKQTNQEVEIIEETDEEMGIFDDITIGEHEIEYVKVEPDIEGKPYDSLNEKVFEVAVDLLPPISTNIQTESEDESINSNDLEKDSNLLESGSSINIISSKNKEKVTKKNKSSEHISEHTSVPETSNNVQKHRFKCKQCDKLFIRLWWLKVHEREHCGEYPYKCDQCGKIFAMLGNLKVHKRVHTGERPFKCDQCERSFTQLVSLKVHKRAHSGERPHLCDQCGKTFSEACNLRIHKLVHSDEHPYECDQCRKSFKHMFGLQKHKRVHSGEHPYKCDQCEKSFSKACNLKTHKLVHSDDEHRYECDQCRKSFKHLFGLQRHKRVHSGEYPYKCDQCEKSFVRLDVLKQHKRVVHSGEKNVRSSETS